MVTQGPLCTFPPGVVSRCTGCVPALLSTSLIRWNGGLQELTAQATPWNRSASCDSEATSTKAVEIGRDSARAQRREGERAMAAYASLEAG